MPSLQEQLAKLQAQHNAASPSNSEASQKGKKQGNASENIANGKDTATTAATGAMVDSANSANSANEANAQIAALIRQITAVEEAFYQRHPDADEEAYAEILGSGATQLRADLYMDEIDLWELAVRAEQRFRHRPSMEEISDWRTIDDVAQYFASHAAQQSTN